MGFNVIFTPLYGVPADESALAAAQITAQRFSGRVAVLHVRADPRTMIPYIGEGMSGALIEEMIASAEQQAEERANRVRQTFDAWRSKAGMPLKEGSEPDGPSCSWTETVGRPDTVIARHGRVADLIVVCRPDGENASTTVTEGLEAALLESGRPLLVAPLRETDRIGTNVAIAWNGSAEASRAVAAALPFLESAEAVTIVSIGDSCPPEADAGALAGYLAQHGVKAKVQTGEVESGKSVGETLISAAKASDADLMVMGAYTHSRLRELVFGGVTRVVLSSDLPVLMAH